MWEMTAYAFFTAWSVAAVTLLGGWCLGTLSPRAVEPPGKHQS